MNLEYPTQIYMNDSLRNALFTGIIQIKNNRIVLRINMRKSRIERDTSSSQSAQGIIDSIPETWGGRRR